MYPHSKKYLNENSIKNINTISEKYFGVGNTKIYIEKVCEFFSKIGGTKFTCIRHSNIYGPNDKFDLDKGHFFAANLLKIQKSKNQKITIWGNGNEMRDMLFISDLINFVNKVIKYQKTNYKLYNCTYGKSFRVIDIIKKIIKLSDKNIKVFHDLSKPSIPLNILVNSSKAKKELKWSPKVNLDEGIKKTIQWMRENL